MLGVLINAPAGYRTRARSDKNAATAAGSFCIARRCIPVGRWGEKGEVFQFKVICFHLIFQLAKRCNIHQEELCDV